MSKSIWEKAFEVSIGNSNGYTKRLHELLTWDKPLVSEQNDNNGKWIEWTNKCSALENLIKNKYPKMKITPDNKILLNG